MNTPDQLLDLQFTGVKDKNKKGKKTKQEAPLLKLDELRKECMDYTDLNGEILYERNYSGMILFPLFF